MKSKELKVVYEDIDTGIEVKCTTFSVEKMQEKYNRRKEKDEVRKLAEEYIDR